MKHVFPKSLRGGAALKLACKKINKYQQRLYNHHKATIHNDKDSKCRRLYE